MNVIHFKVPKFGVMKTVRQTPIELVKIHRRERILLAR
jgi:hypothetical protein